MAARPAPCGYRTRWFSACNGVGDHAEQADGGKQERQDGKGAEDPGDEAFLPPLRFLADALLERLAFSSAACWSALTAASCLRDGKKKRQRGGVGAHQDLRPLAPRSVEGTKAAGLISSLRPLLRKSA